MKQKHWMEIVLWIDDRFTKGWTPEQATVWYTDLKQFDDTDVWASVFHLYETGRVFAPNGSELLARCIIERRQSARADQYRGLPEPRGKPATDWIVKRFGEQLTGQQIVERIHRDKPCNNHDCDVHHGKVEA